MRSLVWSLAGAVLGVGASGAAGELITFRMEGAITSNLLPSGIWSAPRPGDPFFVEYTFDSLTGDDDPSQFRGFYDNTIVSYRLGVGSLTESGAGDSIEVVNHAIDRYVAALPLVRHRAQVIMQASGLHAISSDALPTTIDLDSWALANFIIQASGTSDGALIGDVHRFTLVPAAPSAMVLSLIVLAPMRRRRAGPTWT